MDAVTDQINAHHAVHGVLLRVFDTGVLLLGESGIGKSETALDLIGKGHQLAADDSVLLSIINDELTGLSPELTFEYLEVRGLGILNVREIFGPSSIVRIVKVDLCIEFVEWERAEAIDRLSVNPSEFILLGKAVPKFVIPVSSGRNLSTLVETAVRVFVSRGSGSDAGRKLIEKHSSLVRGV